MKKGKMTCGVISILGCFLLSMSNVGAQNTDTGQNQYNDPVKTSKDVAGKTMDHKIYPAKDIHGVHPAPDKPGNRKYYHAKHMRSDTANHNSVQVRRGSRNLKQDSIHHRSISGREKKKMYLVPDSAFKKR